MKMPKTMAITPRSKHHARNAATAQLNRGLESVLANAVGYGFHADRSRL